MSLLFSRHFCSIIKLHDATTIDVALVAGYAFWDFNAFLHSTVQESLGWNLRRDRVRKQSEDCIILGGIQMTAKPYVWRTLIFFLVAIALTVVTLGAVLLIGNDLPRLK